MDLFPTGSGPFAVSPDGALMAAREVGPIRVLQ